MSNAHYEELITREREKGLLETVFELVEWDESVCMPPGGGAARAEQKALLARLVHERATDPRIGELTDSLSTSMSGTDSIAAANVRVIRRAYDRFRRIPPSLVEELARESTKGVEAWTQARRTSSFRDFAPHLKRMLELKRQEAAAVGYEGHPYDALLDYYEPGCRSTDIDRIFSQLKPGMVSMLERVQRSPRRPDRAILRREYPIEEQRRLGEMVVKLLGFDMNRGRIDTSTHPFCRSMDPGDVRLTTRYSLHDFCDALFSTIHEAGHGLYEQGLSLESVRLPVGKGASCGVHESQSRLWENMVGRSLPFWECLFPKTRDLFPKALADVSLDAFASAINVIEPNFIRVNADEVTYNLHIILRYELETCLVKGDLAVDDVPSAWNAKFQELLGIVPKDDASGCLQDIHWAAGLFGYFPTYTLGNLYAAQFMEKAHEQLPDLEEEFRKGNFILLRDWLNRNIHHHGQRYLPEALCERVTGRRLSCEPLLRHFERKCKTFYNI